MLAPQRPEQLSFFGPTVTASPSDSVDPWGAALTVAMSATAWLLIGCLIWILA